MRRATADIETLISRLSQALASDGKETQRLVRLQTDRPILFIGDIHGDKEAVETVLSRFSPPDTVLVFLGDILDRGPDSCGALLAIANAMVREPLSVHLLMGNHEARGVSTFRPADFWNALSQVESDLLAQHLLRLPLAAWHPDGVFASHGGLPDLLSLDAIDNIELGSTAWRALTWGDWVSDDQRSTQAGSRPAFGPTAFEQRCSQLGIRTLIRSHQPSAPTYLFRDRCLTLFTSHSYSSAPRQVARWLPGGTVQTARDLQLITI